MATINASKWGYARVTAQSSHSAARNATTSQAQGQQSSGVAQTFSYEAASSGRGLTYSIYRAFFYVDTSSITSTVASATLNVKGFTNGGSRAILVPSTAFGGDGSASIAAGDYDNLSFNTNYNSSFTIWNTSSNNAITLNSTALSDIQNNNYFICALIEYDYDYSNSDPGTATSEVWGIGFDTTPYLDYTLSAASGPTNLSSLNGVAKASISSVSGVAIANIDEINGVT